MFYSGKSGKLVGPNVPARRLVVEKRQRTYENKVKTLTGTRTIVSHGWEIVREILVAPSELEIEESAQERMPTIPHRRIAYAK